MQAKKIGEILKPDAAGIERAAGVVLEGGVVAFPTETFYGLAADARNETALQKIFRVKGREKRKPLLLLIADQTWLTGLVKEIPPAARMLMDRFWPGPLTLVFAAGPDLSPLLTARTGKIGLRVSSHPVAQSLVQQVGRPITATSANLSGQTSLRSAGEVVTSLGLMVDAVLEGGETAGGLGSTVLDVTSDPPEILRSGAVSEADLSPFLKGL